MNICIYNVIKLHQEVIHVKINKAYKFRIYPTLEQQNQINKTLGCTRLIYNYYLNKKQTLYNTQ